MITTYNPQEWGRQGPVGGEYVPHSAVARARGTREYTGMESRMPEPPPPYTSSPTTASGSISAQTSPRGQGSSASQAQAYGSIPGQQQAMPSSFPPPPPSGQRDRSMSRTRNMFSALTSRNRSGEVQAAPPSSYVPVAEQATAPAARRAMSAGAVSHTNHRPRVSSSEQLRDPTNSSSNVAVTGMALPPPPPGPPPAGSRSQSMNRAADRDARNQNILSPIPTRVAQLGPVPPTPADWVDEPEPAYNQAPPPPPPPAAGPPAPAGRPGLQLNTQFAVESDDQGREVPDNVFSAIEPGKQANIGRSLVGITRENSGRGIRERRSEARAQRAGDPLSAVEGPSTTFPPTLEETKPANLVLSLSNSSIARKPHVAKQPNSPLVSAGTPGPRSAAKQEQALSAKRPAPAEPSSAASLPGGRSVTFSPDPPASSFSTGVVDYLRERPGSAIRPGPSSATTNGEPESASLLSAKSTGTDRPISHIFHTPNEDSQMLIPLTPLRAPPSASALPGAANSEAAAFGVASMERHRIFAEKEAAATDDLERLELFAEFIVHESRLRRDRYSEAFDSMGSDVLDLTRDLWRTFTSRRSKTPTSAAAKSSTPAPATTPGASNQTDGQQGREPSSASTGPPSAPYTPLTEPDSSPAVASAGGRYRSDSARNNSYQPCLSPIPSQATRSVVDDEDSRGRSAARWWESSTDDNSVGGARRIERSKRESKYMGVPHNAIQNLQWQDSQASQASPLYHESAGTPGPSNPYAHLGANEYPPEKMGWHDPTTPSSIYNGQITPQPRKFSIYRLDVSRLITLPPPYPRHHPAVNNNHPDLVGIRAALNIVSDKSEMKEMRERFEGENGEHFDLADTVSSVGERRRELRIKIGDKVGRGEMSFADAARAEAEFDDRETKRSRDLAQKQFDSFQNGLLSPLSASVTDKINKASTAIDQLRDSLNNDAQNSNPNLAQEQGDEQPELLEKVTLMKWFFEAREQLYREHFDLQAESDDRYKHVILAPYRAAGNIEKIREVDAFFTKDKLERRAENETKALQRFEAFLETVESHVRAGVESQLSAFWDIAPSLLEVIQKVPQRLDGFQVQIPINEYEENPSYEEFPTQYLYTLLLHTEKSAYQFIESQTNLLCLLHEVKTGITLAQCRVHEAERLLAGEDHAAVEMDVQHAMHSEDTRLTSDLQERVNLVEDQWREALGNGLEDCKGRIEAFLVERGGWDDSLQE